MSADTGAEGSSTWSPQLAARRYGPEVGLIVVDVQNDFADPGGSLYVGGGEGIVPLVDAEIERALAAGAAVVYTQDWHPAHTPHFAVDGGIWPVHCVQETWGAAFHPDLSVRGPVVRKGANGEDGYSGFTMRDAAAGSASGGGVSAGGGAGAGGRAGAGGASGEIPTELHGLLSNRCVKRIVVCGLATDYCVKATALDGVRLGYETAVLLEAVRAVDLTPGDGESSLEELAAAGAVLVGGRGELSGADAGTGER